VRVSPLFSFYILVLLPDRPKTNNTLRRMLNCAFIVCVVFEECAGGWCVSHACVYHCVCHSSCPVLLVVPGTPCLPFFTPSMPQNYTIALLFFVLQSSSAHHLRLQNAGSHSTGKHLGEPHHLQSVASSERAHGPAGRGRCPQQYIYHDHVFGKDIIRYKRWNKEAPQSGTCE